MPAPIDKGVPIPKAKTCARAFDWYAMQVGDSFLSSYINPKPPAALTKAGWRFRTRRIADPKLDRRPYRIWRVK